MATRTAWAVLLLGLLPCYAVRESIAQIPESITTPDVVKSPIGTLEYENGVPTLETAERVKDHLALIRGVNVYNNSFRGASALAIAKGFESIGAEDNSVIISGCSHAFGRLNVSA